MQCNHLVEHSGKPPVIDFHTHAFPDDVAPRGLAALLKNYAYECTPATDMTAGDLARRCGEWGVDLAVLMPVITKPSQTERINLWAAEIERSALPLRSFGGIWPHGDGYKRDIDFVVSLGLPGIKLHAEYQDFVLDDPEMLKIYDYAFSRGLMILHHGGNDPGLPPPYKTSPRQFAAVADAMKGGVMIAAHLGSHNQWDDVERYLVGKNIYLDTSMGSEFYPREQFLRIVEAHGAERILFGTDSPWSDTARELDFIRSLPLTVAQRDLILGGNAARLLAPKGF